MDHSKILSLVKEDKNIDLPTFKLFLTKNIDGDNDEMYYSDKNYIYYLDEFYEYGPYDHREKLIIISKNKNYEIVKEFGSNIYRISNNIGYIREDKFELFNRIDATSFDIKKGVLYDKNSIYTYEGSNVKGISTKNLKIYNYKLVSNNEGLYYDNSQYSAFPNFELISDVDVTSLTQIKEYNNSTGFFKDKRNIYYQSLDYFRTINYCDQNSIHFFDGILEDFLIYKDRALIFQGGTFIKNSDSESFKHIEGRFYKDKNNVYYLSEIGNELRILEGVDSKTFSYNINALDNIESEYHKTRTKDYFFKDKIFFYKLYEEEGFNISGNWNYGREKLEYIFKLEKSKEEFDSQR